MAPRKTVLKLAAAFKPRKPSKLPKPANPTKQAKPFIGRKSSMPLRGRNAVFAGKIFVMSGEFPNPHDMMEDWINHHGGRVDKVVTDETTHLVHIIENFKNKVIHGFKSPYSICPRPRRISEKSYQLEKILAGKQKEKTKKVCEKKNDVKDSEASKEVIEPPCYHLYIDRTSFQYKVVLHRTMPTAKGKRLKETFTIYLFESNPSPPTYIVAKKYKRVDLPAVLYHDKDVGKGFYEAFAEWKSIFEDKTGIQWDQRLDKLQHDKQNYVYLPPSGGKPVGMLPPGWKEPKQEMEQESDGSTAVSEELADCRETDPDLMDDTDSGDDAN